MKRGRHEPIRFLLLRWRYVARGDTLFTVRAEYRSVVLRKIHATINNPVIEHLNKVAFTDFLIVGDKAFTMSAGHF